MGGVMTHKDFRHWRKSLKLSQKQAAEALGLKRRVVQYYEKGERDGEKVEIPRAVRLACYALAQGIGDYRGPDRPTAPFAVPQKDAKPQTDVVAEAPESPTAESVD